MSDVLCRVGSRYQAQQIVNTLQMAGFPNNEISVMNMRPEPHPTGRTKGLQGAVVGLQIGIILGGITGWLAGVGAMAMLDSHSFLVMNPALPAICGALVGAATCTLAGGLAGLGIKELDSGFEGEQENVFISAHAADPDLLEQAREIFEESDAEAILISEEELEA